MAASGATPEGEPPPRSVVESVAAGDNGKRGVARRGLLADRNPRSLRGPKILLDGIDKLACRGILTLDTPGNNFVP
jgi:hypothetical protein